MGEHCITPNCIKHGNLRVRGLVEKGFVKSTKAKNTAVVIIPFFKSIPKFERVEKRTSKIHVHVPPCEVGNVKEGDYIEFGECRKVSKTKSHVFMRKVKQSKHAKSEEKHREASEKHAAKHAEKNE